MSSEGGQSPRSAAGDIGEDRRKHLEFIQVVIGRMSSASAVAKGWSLTVATAAFGYAGTKDAVNVALLGMFTVILFGYIDSRYLMEERKFRALFRDARLGAVDVYDMDAREYAKRESPRRAPDCSWQDVCRSWTLLGFYVPLLLVGVAVLIHTLVASP